MRHRYFGLLTMVFVGAIAYAEGVPVHAAAGVTEDVYYSLSGVWLRAGETDVETEETEFSWGKCRYVPNGSRDFDLGADPPLLSVLGGRFNIKEVIQVGHDVYRLKMVWKRYNVADTAVDLVVHLESDGTMWWEPNGIMGQGSAIRYRKIDGPRRSTR